VVSSGYFKAPATRSIAGDGSGRRCRVDRSHGYLAIVDRSKDLIKSGGEWISSIALESAACGHPEVMQRR